VSASIAMQRLIVSILHVEAFGYHVNCLLSYRVTVTRALAGEAS
jgi:hypothetical protein